MNKASDHAPECEWHFEQYPWECDCGLESGHAGKVVIDKQLLTALLSTAKRKQHVFDDYEKLHADKGTEEGKRKAAANHQHAADLVRVLDQIDLRQLREPTETPLTDTMEFLFNKVEERGGIPAGVVLTENLKMQLTQETKHLRSSPAPISGDLVLAKEVTHFKGCEIVTVPESQWHSAALVCTEKSPVLKLARHMRANG